MSTAGVGSGPQSRVEPWKTWWIWLWGLVSVVLIVSVWFRTPWMIWSVMTVFAFGIMEGIGLTHASVGYPPLTQVIREYIPRWLALSLIYGCTGLAGATWFHIPDRLGLAVLIGLLGWFTAHFDNAFDHAAVAQENAKYAWFAERVGFPSAAARIRARHAPVAPPEASVLSGGAPQQ
jgi:hypothetical protein